MIGALQARLNLWGRGFGIQMVEYKLLHQQRERDFLKGQSEYLKSTLSDGILTTAPNIHMCTCKLRICKKHSGTVT